MFRRSVVGLSSDDKLANVVRFIEWGLLELFLAIFSLKGLLIPHSQWKFDEKRDYSLSMWLHITASSFAVLVGREKCCFWLCLPFVASQRIFCSMIFLRKAMGRQVAFVVVNKNNLHWERSSLCSVYLTKQKIAEISQNPQAQVSNVTT